jgi:hypothetical protein
VKRARANFQRDWDVTMERWRRTLGAERKKESTEQLRTGENACAGFTSPILRRGSDEDGGMRWECDAD